MVQDQRFTAVDLFAGAGGLTEGLKAAGFSIVAAVELDDLAVETYRLNHPEVRVYHDDIRSVDPRMLIAEGQLDLLAGCPPCQGFSSLRTRRRQSAAADPRNDLVDEFARFAEALRPRAVLMENVPGLARDPRFTRLRRRLRKLGYRTRAAIVDAAEFGVPQRRRRLLLMASRDAYPRLAKASVDIRTVRHAIGAIDPPRASSDPVHSHGEQRSQQIRERITAIPHDGGSRSSLPGQLACHERIRGFHDVYGRMSWDEVAPTITSGCINPSKGRFLHPEEDRAITLREAALLQTFPADYQFSMRRGKYAAAVLVGNALPPELVKRQAGALRVLLREIR